MAIFIPVLIILTILLILEDFNWLLRRKIISLPEEPKDELLEICQQIEDLYNEHKCDVCGCIHKAGGTCPKCKLWAARIRAKHAIQQADKAIAAARDIIREAITQEIYPTRTRISYI